MNEKFRLPVDGEVDQVRKAIINKTIISIGPFVGADRGIILILADGTTFGVGFSADDGDFYLDMP